MGRKVFNICNYCIMIITGLLCLLPFVNLLAISFSGQFAVNSNQVMFVPVDFNLKSYEFVIKNVAFVRAFGITIARVLLGTTLNLAFMIPAAYALSKEKNEFKHRNLFAWFFIITILVDAGLVPWYMTVKNTGIMNSIWALVLPDALPVFSMVVLMNFMRGLPKEMEEAAFMDGAGYFRTLVQIILPVCAPSIATVALFAIVGHWNAWFDGLLFMNRTEYYPLQSYLQTVIINPEAFLNSQRSSGNSAVRELLNFVSARSSRAAQLFIGTLPILMVYPFLQKYFAAGLVMGSVKG